MYHFFQLFGPQKTLLSTDVEDTSYTNPDEDVMEERRNANQYFYEFGSDRAAAVKQIHKVYGASQTTK